jgi:cold shock CspA family protein
VYFHYTEIVGNDRKHGHKIIEKNEIVSFELFQGSKGPYAKNVRKLGKEQKL